MPRRITITPHLSIEELEKRYRRASDAVVRAQFQILWLLSQGRSTRQVAEVTGYSAPWIRMIVRRYNRSGPAAITDGRRTNPGAQPLLPEQLQSELYRALQADPPDGGKWNSRKVAEWMSKQLTRSVAVQRGWEYLRALESDAPPFQMPHPRIQSLAARFRKQIEDDNPTD